MNNVESRSFAELSRDFLKKAEFFREELQETVEQGTCPNINLQVRLNQSFGKLAASLEKYWKVQHPQDSQFLELQGLREGLRQKRNMGYLLAPLSPGFYRLNYEGKEQAWVLVDQLAKELLRGEKAGPIIDERLPALFASALTFYRQQKEQEGLREVGPKKEFEKTLSPEHSKRKLKFDILKQELTKPEGRKLSTFFYAAATSNDYGPVNISQEMTLEFCELLKQFYHQGRRIKKLAYTAPEHVLYVFCQWAILKYSRSELDSLPLFLMGVAEGMEKSRKFYQGKAFLTDSFEHELIGCAVRLRSHRQWHRYYKFFGTEAQKALKALEIGPEIFLLARELIKEEEERPVRHARSSSLVSYRSDDEQGKSVPLETPGSPFSSRTSSGGSERDLGHILELPGSSFPLRNSSWGSEQDLRSSPETASSALSSRRSSGNLEQNLSDSLSYFSLDVSDFLQQTPSPLSGWSRESSSGQSPLDEI